jgi:hypothetical protein
MQWVVFAKRPFAGPQAVLAYLARYTHRVAISNSHYGLIAGTLRARKIERGRQALAELRVSPQSAPAEANRETEPLLSAHRRPCCGGRMIIVETFDGPRPARSPSPNRIRIDTS